MTEVAAAYATTLAALLSLAVLMLIQFAVADVAGIRAGHVPGTPVAGGHGDFLFRATRAHANSNENLPLLVLTLALCLLLGTDARWTGILTWAFVAGRLGHMVFYYADLRLARSGAFVVGVIAQLGLLGLALAAWF